MAPMSPLRKLIEELARCLQEAKVLVGDQRGPIGGPTGVMIRSNIGVAQATGLQILDPSQEPILPGSPPGMVIRAAMANTAAAYAAQFEQWATEAKAQADKMWPNHEYIADRMASIASDYADTYDALVLNGPNA